MEPLTKEQMVEEVKALDHAMKVGIKAAVDVFAERTGLKLHSVDTTVIDAVRHDGDSFAYLVVHAILRVRA